MSASLQYFSHEIFLIARSYRVLAVKIKVLSVSVLVALETRLKSPAFGRFIPIFGIFQAAHFGTSL